MFTGQAEVGMMDARKPLLLWPAKLSLPKSLQMLPVSRFGGTDPNDVASSTSTTASKDYCDYFDPITLGQ
jgi:hypothetical protein